MTVNARAHTHVHTHTCMHIHEYTLILIIYFHLTICLLLCNAVLSNLLRLFIGLFYTNWIIGKSLFLSYSSHTFFLKGIKNIYNFSPCRSFKVCRCQSSEADRPAHPSSGDYKMLSMWLELSWIQRMRRWALNGNMFSYSSCPAITGDGTIATLWFQK